MVDIKELEKKLLAEDGSAEEITACYDKVLGDHMYLIMHDNVCNSICLTMKDMLKEAVEEGMTTGRLTKWAETAVNRFEGWLKSAGFKIQAERKVIRPGTVGYMVWGKEPVLHKDLRDDLVKKTRDIMEKFLDDAGIDILYSQEKHETDPLRVPCMEKGTTDRLMGQVSQIRLSDGDILIPRELAQEISKALCISDMEKVMHDYIFDSDAWADFDEDEIVEAVCIAGGEEEFCRLAVENAEWDPNVLYGDNIFNNAQKMIRKLIGKED